MFERLDSVEFFYLDSIVRFLIISETFDINVNIFNIYKIVNSDISQSKNFNAQKKI